MHQECNQFKTNGNRQKDTSRVGNEWPETTVFCVLSGYDFVNLPQAERGEKMQWGIWNPPQYTSNQSAYRIQLSTGLLGHNNTLTYSDRKSVV